MKLTLIEKITKLYDDQIVLKIDESELEKAESASQNYSNQTGKNYAHINSLVSNIFVKYLRENLFTNNERITTNLPATWEFVNGSSITLNIEFSDDESSQNNLCKKPIKKERKLILIPSDNLDIEEFTIPKEWVDIPNWAGDYYLPVQVNLEEKYLHFWGYISRQSLKKKAEYNHIFRNYYVEQIDLISDLDLLWSAMIICEEKGVIDSLSELSPNSVQNLINQLSEKSPYSPRLKVDFEQWEGLLNDKKCLQNLYKKRLEETELIPAFNQSIAISLTNLLKNVFTENCLHLEEFIQQQRQVLVWMDVPFRNTPFLNDLTTEQIKQDTTEQMQREVRELYQKQDQIALSSDLSPEEALIYLLENTTNQTILWECADYLHKIHPHHSRNAIRMVMDLGLQLMGYPLALIMAVLPQPNQKIAVRLRVYPARDLVTLPSGINLVVLEENGNKIPQLDALSRNQDDCIQLYFMIDRGDRFGVSVSLQTAKITEYFEV